MKKKIFIKITALLLLLITFLCALCACSVRKVPAGKLALTSVGEVNGNEVLYEELYYLTANYLPSLRAQYGNDTEALKKALQDTVYENIVTNSAILALCEEAGVSVDEATLKKNVQNEIDALVEEECDGKRSEYVDMLKDADMTDHYMRETMRIDLLYSELPAKYFEKGLIPSGESTVKAYVSENFLRTQHIAVLVENGETREENLVKANEALEKYQSGELSFFKLIGSKYNEDLSPLTSDGGYYFARGSVESAYEEAVLALDINGVSGIIEGTGQSNITGDTVPCFYIIQRLAIDEEYVSENLTDMQDKCADAIIADALEEKKATLSFTPNDFCSSLDLTALDYPKDGFDFVVFFTAFGCTLAVGAVALVILFNMRRRQKRIAARRAKNKK